MPALGPAGVLLDVQFQGNSGNTHRRGPANWLPLKQPTCALPRALQRTLCAYRSLERSHVNEETCLCVLGRSDCLWA